TVAVRSFADRLAYQGRMRDLAKVDGVLERGGERPRAGDDAGAQLRSARHLVDKILPADVEVATAVLPQVDGDLLHGMRIDERPELPRLGPEIVVLPKAHING